MKAAWMSCLMALWAPSAFANASEPESARGEQAQIYQRTQLIAGTPIPLEMAQTVTTQGGSWKEDDMFNMIVSEDVAIGEYVVIPRGTLAVGHVRWATGRGAFGKSGKIEVSVDHLVLGGRKIRLSGVHRKEGRGELTTTGTVAAAGPLAALIPGESAEIAQGSVLTAYLAENLGVVIPYKPSKMQQGGPDTTMVRARQISVAEAFKPDASSSRVPAPKAADNRRVTVAEAFKEELAGLDDE